MATGCFITLEGGEAVGKTTQLQRLAHRWEVLGRRVVRLRETGGTPLGERLRDLLKYAPEGVGMDAKTELLLLTASRAELVAKVIRPELAAGSVVLCDRFLDSTMAYQVGGRGLSAKVVEPLIELAVGDTRPDLTFWLRVPPAEARRRRQARGAALPEKSDRFEAENEAFFFRVDAAYRKLAEQEPIRFRIVDGSGSEETVAETIWSGIEEHLKCAKPQLIFTTQHEQI
jgi:dTMP kinase